MSQLTGIDLIIHDLETAEEEFTPNYYHVVHHGVCKFCAEGILMKRSDIPFSNKQDGINDVDNTVVSSKSYYTKTNERYGIGIFRVNPEDKFVSYREGYIECYLCKHILGTLHHLITHMNDFHSSSHKETAHHLSEMSKMYDLVTGQPYLSTGEEIGGT